MSELNRRILIVDDNADIHNDFKKILIGKDPRSRTRLQSIEKQLFSEEDSPKEPEPEWNINYELSFALQGEEAVAMVDRAYEEGRPFALAFMDVRMPPGIDGIEAIRRIWKRHPNVEIVICTAYSDYSFDAILEKLGSSDHLLFLNKPFDSIAVKQMAHSLTQKWNLHQQARRHVKLLELEVAQRQESEDRLQHLIHHDRLTGLGNRNWLQIKLDRAIKEASANETRFALFFVDLDRFSEIVDTLGYQNGDQLIVNIARRLTSNFGHACSIFRQSNAEFALLIPEISALSETSDLADAVQKSFESGFDLEGFHIEIRPQIGIVIYPDHGCTRDMLMRHADMTLTHTKGSGPCTRFFSSGMNFHTPQRLLLLTELRQAILSDRLLLYFQPQINLKNKKIAGVEAVLRWPHDQLGFISPKAFIPLAERCGLVKSLTSWVVSRAFRQWSLWKAAGLELKLAINLTSNDFQDLELPQMIGQALEKFKVPADFISFEVSERGVMVDPEQATDVIHKINHMGIRITIDHFGKGFSSLAYLKKLPIQEIKIDRSFVSEVGENLNELAILKSMIELGHNLGLEVTAEGVDSERVLNTLESYGCDFVQGTVINHPVPPGELQLWLKNSRWPVEQSAANLHRDLPQACGAKV